MKDFSGWTPQLSFFLASGAKCLEFWNSYVLMELFYLIIKLIPFFLWPIQLCIIVFLQIFSNFKRPTVMEQVNNLFSKRLIDLCYNIYIYITFSIHSEANIISLLNVWWCLNYLRYLTTFSVLPVVDLLSLWSISIYFTNVEAIFEPASIITIYELLKVYIKKPETFTERKLS